MGFPWGGPAGIVFSCQTVCCSNSRRWSALLPLFIICHRRHWEHQWDLSRDSRWSLRLAVTSLCPPYEPVLHEIMRPALEAV
jgi:hypothetical protein